MYQHFETNKQSIFTLMTNKDQPSTFTATWYTFFLNWIFPLFKVLQIRFFNGYQISSLHLIRSTATKHQIISFFFFFFFLFFLFFFSSFIALIRYQTINYTIQACASSYIFNIVCMLARGSVISESRYSATVVVFIRILLLLHY